MEKEQIIQPNLIIPVGTAIVVLADVIKSNEIILHEGSVGVISQSPPDNTHRYHARFPDGTVLALKRQEFAVQKHYRREGLERHVLGEHDLYDSVMYRCIVGSHAYGLSHENSDIDRRGIYLAPAEMHWSLYGVPEQLEQGEECYWELQKFLVLALKANPNILECLYTPLVEHVSPLAQELLAMRHIFVTKLLYQTYNGYVLAQFKKLNKHLENHGTIRWKHAMHLIRLLLAGIATLQTGDVMVDAGEYREKLLTIGRGEMAWEDINQWRLQLHREFDAAYQVSQLPDRPDYEAANAYLIRARKSQVHD